MTKQEIMIEINYFYFDPALTTEEIREGLEDMKKYIEKCLRDHPKGSPLVMKRG